MCHDIADALPELIVLMVSDDLPFTDCGGRKSPYDLRLLRETQDATTLLDVGRDKTAYVVEYVRAFDAQVPSGTPPPRRGPPQPGPEGELTEVVVLSVLIALVFLGTTGYLVCEVWAQGRKVALLERSWQARTNARLNRLADRVMRVDDTGRTSCHSQGLRAGAAELRVRHDRRTARSGGSAAAHARSDDEKPSDNGNPNGRSSRSTAKRNAYAKPRNVDAAATGVVGTASPSGRRR